MTEKYIMITKEKFDNAKAESDKLYGELSNRLITIVGLLTGYDLGIEEECSDWDSINEDVRLKLALDKSKELMSFLEAVEDIREYDYEEISEDDLKEI